MTRLSPSLSSRPHSRKRDRYRSISTLDRSADSFRNNGRINSPEARDRSYRDRSEIEVEQRQKKEEGETNPEPILFFLSLEEMLNFTVKFNESMDRFGRKTGGWVSRKQPPTNFFSSFVPQRRGYPNRSLFTIFRGILAFQAFSRSFVRAGRLPRDTWPPPDLPRFTPLAELESDRKDKGRESAQPPCGSIFARSRFKNSARPISIFLFPFAFDRRLLHRFSIVIVGSFRRFVLRSG